MAARTGRTTIDRLANTGAVHARGLDNVRPSLRAKAGRFLMHFLEMGLSMGIGMVALDPIYRWAAGQLGYVNPYLQLPELTLLVSAFDMTLPMAAWMRFRGMDWGSIAEMSGAMFVEAVLILGGYWLGVLPNVSAGKMSTLGHLQHGLMLPAMLAAMLLRLNVYTSHAHHRAHAR